MVAVDHDRGSGAVRGLHVHHALVVAEKMDAVARKSRGQGEVQLARRHHVEAQPFFGDDTQELRRSEGLRRVQHLARTPHGRDVLRRAPAHSLFVVDIQRGSMPAGEIDEVAATHLHVASGVDPVRDREEQPSGSALVRAGAARAARAAAASAAAARLAREVGEGRRLAAAGKSEARDKDPRLVRLARGAHLRGVALGESGQDLELLGAALASILVDGHFSERF